MLRQHFIGAVSRVPKNSFAFCCYIPTALLFVVGTN